MGQRVIAASETRLGAEVVRRFEDVYRGELPRPYRLGERRERLEPALVSTWRGDTRRWLK